MKERPPEFTFRDQKPPEQNPSWRRVLEETQTLQDQKLASEGRHSLETTEVAPVFANDRPKLFLFPSDMHWFSPQTDYNRIKEVFEVLERPDTFGLFLGDEIDGEKRDAPEQVSEVLYNSGIQIQKFREVLIDLASRGKIMAIEGGYHGHAEWVKRFSGLDGIQVMADRVRFPDGSEIKILMPWGTFAPEFPGGKGFSILTFHNPGGGASDDINPNGAVRKRVIEYRQNPHNKNKPVVGAVGGDKHHRGAVSLEKTFDPITGKETTKILASLGSFKGLNSKNPDPFLATMGKGLSVPPGFGMVVIPRRMENGSIPSANFIWAAYGDGFGKVVTLHEAASLWDAAERQKITRELIAEIIAKKGKPTMLTDNRRSSNETTTDESIDNRRSRLYRRFGKVIDGPPDMSYRIDFFANSRYGSTSSKKSREILHQLVDDAVKDPYTFFLGGRHLLDGDLASSKDREKYLNMLFDDLTPIYNEGRLMAVQMSTSWRNKKWQKDIVHNGKVVSEGLRAGDELFLNSSIKNTTLYTNEAIFTLRIGDRDFVLQLPDHLGGAGSKEAPFRGLARRQGEGAISAVGGGHMPGSGWEQTPFVTRWAPGWPGAEYDSEGIGNKKKGSSAGISADFYKGEIYMAHSREVSNDMHPALMIHGGTNDALKKKILSKVK